MGQQKYALPIPLEECLLFDVREYLGAPLAGEATGADAARSLVLAGRVARELARAAKTKGFRAMRMAQARRRRYRTGQIGRARAFVLVRLAKRGFNVLHVHGTRVAMAKFAWFVRAETGGPLHRMASRARRMRVLLYKCTTPFERVWVVWQRGGLLRVLRRIAVNTLAAPLYLLAQFIAAVRRIRWRELFGREVGDSDEVVKRYMACLPAPRRRALVEWYVRRRLAGGGRTTPSQAEIAHLMHDMIEMRRGAQPRQSGAALDGAPHEHAVL